MESIRKSERNRSSLAWVKFGEYLTANIAAAEESENSDPPAYALKLFKPWSKR